MVRTVDITTTSQWRTLQALGAAHTELGLRRMFVGDPSRVSRMTHEIGDLVVDLSKHLVTPEIVEQLLGLARFVGLTDQVRAMAAGERVNTSQDRPALHMALRAPPDAVVVVNGRNIVEDVHRVLHQMDKFTRCVRAGEWLGATGRPIDTVVNVGIGGSDLGPAMAYEALAAFHHRQLRCRFVANIDAADLESALVGLDPATTMFVIASKSFVTSETIRNAISARRWIVDRLGAAAVGRHFVAVSANAQAVEAFGIGPENRFDLWDWVGGRYSLGSAIGLSLMLAIGPEAFRDMLGGFRTVDEHFESMPLECNVPALLGLLGVWYRTFCDLPTRAVLPYCHGLRSFPTYLGQLDMESNGKRAGVNGAPISYNTGAIVWGEAGTRGQHSFHQLLHQGTTVVPADFIVMARPSHPTRSVDREVHETEAHNDQLVANCLAQSTALAFGRTAEETAADTAPALVGHCTFPGNRPSTMIMAPRLSPSVLGQLIALYEHQVFTQAAIWGINPFDQWGVELGKTLANSILADLNASATNEQNPMSAAITSTTVGLQPAATNEQTSVSAASHGNHDASTTALISRYRSMNTG